MHLFPDSAWHLAATTAPTWEVVLGACEDHLKETLQTLNDEFDTEHDDSTNLLMEYPSEYELAATRSF